MYYMSNYFIFVQITIITYNVCLQITIINLKSFQNVFLIHPLYRKNKDFYQQSVHISLRYPIDKLKNKYYNLTYEL